MGKTKATKQEVYEFVEKVRVKAIKAIGEEFKANYDKEVEEWFKGEGAELRKLNNQLLQLKKKGQEIYSKIDSRKVASRWYRKNWEDANLSFDELDIFNAHTPEDHKAKQIKKIWEEKEQEVRTEYGKLRSYCEQCRDGNAAVNLLNSLGFDTSNIVRKQEKANIDKTKIFVCGDNK